MATGELVHPQVQAAPCPIFTWEGKQRCFHLSTLQLPGAGIFRVAKKTNNQTKKQKNGFRVPMPPPGSPSRFPGSKGARAVSSGQLWASAVGVIESTRPRHCSPPQRFPEQSRLRERLFIRTDPAKNCHRTETPHCKHGQKDTHTQAARAPNWPLTYEKRSSPQDSGNAIWQRFGNSSQYLGKCHSLWRNRKPRALFEEQVGNKRQQSLNMFPALRLAHRLLRVSRSPSRTGHLPRRLRPRAKRRRCTQPREGLGLPAPMGVRAKVPASVSKDTGGVTERTLTRGDGQRGRQEVLLREVRRRRSWRLGPNHPRLCPAPSGSVLRLMLPVQSSPGGHEATDLSILPITWLGFLAVWFRAFVFIWLG